MIKEVLQERIQKKEKAIQKLEKKIVTISNLSSQELIDACKSNNRDLYKQHQGEVKENSRYYSGYDLWSAYRDLEESQETLKKYKNQLEAEFQKEKSLNGLPEIFNELQEMLIKSWDEFDIARRDKIKSAVKELDGLEYNEWKIQRRLLIEKYGLSYEDKANETNEHIHQENVKSAKNIVLDLIDRVSSKTGKITSYDNLHLASNNEGFSILNGYVVGENGKAKVESILAGGYNIQRLHIRVLVK